MGFEVVDILENLSVFVDLIRPLQHKGVVILQGLSGRAI
jgi:hypothetical protein